MLLIKLLITKALYYILCITQFLMDFVLNLDTEKDIFFYNNYPYFYRSRNGLKQTL